MGWVSGQTGRWRVVCERDGWVCWVCGGQIDKSLSPPNRLAGTVDHIVALVHGGSDDDANVRAAHFTCNVRRFHTVKPLAMPAGVTRGI
jgi:5-methylcytosine-specific restriction endonuclease McrA